MERFKKLPYEHFQHISISSDGRLRNDESMSFYKLRILKGKGLVYCDINKSVEGINHRKTILISREVALAFLPLPGDFYEKEYRAVNKKGFSKLVNTTRSIEWKTQSKIMKQNMIDYPQYRNELAKRQKEKYKNYPKKKRIKKSKIILSKDNFLKEKIELENRLEFVNKTLNNFYK